MKILVTGATGLLGGHLVRRLVEYDNEVVALVRDKRGYTPNFDEAAHRLTSVYGDLSDYRLIERALYEYQVEAVLHLAAQTQVRISDGSPYSTFEANIRGTYTMLEACRSYGRLKRIVLASSDKAYGGQPCPYTEAQTVAGEYPYDVSKSCGDLLAKSYHVSYDLPIVIVRCCNLYGPGDLNWQRIIPATMRFAFCDEPLSLRGGGKMKRDYLYVLDAVEAYLKCLKTPDIIGEVFNFGTGKPVEIQEIVDRALNLAGCGRTPLVEEGHDKEIKHQWMDSTKARERLLWKPTVDLEMGLAMTVPWYRHYLTERAR